MKQLLCAFTLSASLAVAACDQPAPDPIVHVAMPSHPYGAYLSRGREAGCWIFVSMPSGSIAVVHRDNGRLELVRTVKVPGAPQGMTLTPDGGTLVAAATGQVLFLDAKRLISGDADPVLTNLTDGPKPGSTQAALTPGGKTLFVTDESAATITVIDLAHGPKSLGQIPTGRNPVALAFSKDGRYLYSTAEIAQPAWNWPAACRNNPEGAIVVIDIARAQTDPANSVVSRVPAGCVPVRLALSPSGDRLFATVRDANSILAFDSAKLVSDPEHARLNSIPTGPAPVPLAIAGRFLISGDSDRSNSDQRQTQLLHLFSLDLLQPVRTIPAGAYPREMTVSPDSSTLFLTNFWSDTLQIIDLKRVISQ